MIIASSPVFYFICYMCMYHMGSISEQSIFATPLLHNIYSLFVQCTHTYTYHPYHIRYSSASHITHGEFWSQQKIAIYNLLFSFPNTLSESRWRQRLWRWCRWRRKKNTYLCTKCCVVPPTYWCLWSTLRLLKSSVIRVGLIKFLSPRCGMHICNINWIKADGDIFRLWKCAKLWTGVSRLMHLFLYYVN